MGVVRSTARIAVGVALLALATPGASLAQGDCRIVKSSCSAAKRQNLAYCKSDRRSGMSYEGCLHSGDRAMQECLRTGRWQTGRRNWCGLARH
jgi:hypothetical protein